MWRSTDETQTNLKRMAGGETWWTNKINLLNVYECNIDLIEQTGLLHKQG
jgi:hypothetical protein